jgi:uncharacterized membrane protein YphA (DoxX/SURF4 family)
MIPFLKRFVSILVAVIFLQTLYFKFTGKPESIYIFSKLGIEPFGRIISGILELIAGILLISKKFSIYGAILGLVVITGAIFSHIFVLGIEVQNDGGTLFFLAVIVFLGCLLTIFWNRNQLVQEWPQYFKQKQ